MQVGELAGLAVGSTILLNVMFAGYNNLLISLFGMFHRKITNYSGQTKHFASPFSLFLLYISYTNLDCSRN